MHVEENLTAQANAASRQFDRRMQFGPSDEPLLLTLAETRGERPREVEVRVRWSNEGGTHEWSLATDDPRRVALVLRGGDVALLVRPGGAPTNCTVRLAQASDAAPSTPSESAGDARIGEGASPADLLDWKSQREMGGRRWGEPLRTRGKLADDQAARPYVLDELTIPFDNPFHALFFISGLDFFPDGVAALCTAHGDVWLVRGIDEDLDDLSWQRFATGLYQPLGLKIIDGDVVVVGRDQLTRLVDGNGDGEADEYLSISHDLQTQGQDHAYAMRLEVDSHGNLFFLKSSEGPPHGASLLKLPRGGTRLEAVARGFRHPYGLGIGPNDQLTVADNEGNWVPSSKIDLIKPGGFYGYIERDPQQENADVERPLCYLPKFIDNSCGGQTWVTSDRWGPYHQGEMLHLSWGRCTLHAVLRQRVDDVWQAATVRFPGITFRAGSGVADFHPLDGQLYVAGLDGWQTAAVADGCFQRVRYTGAKVRMPAEFATYADGVRLSYSVDLADELQADDFQVAHWNYRRSAVYGSFHYRPSAPDEIGHDSLVVRNVRRLDSHTVFLEIDGLRPVDQLQVTARVRSADGVALEHEILATVNRLPQPYASTRAGGAFDLLRRENLTAWCIVPFD
ncbi:MAG: hypothetical protein KDA61_18660, partial [Planctomycetales bacterium]|nr:hypothetical protein [Planctomycetales bacterium]